MGQLALHTRDEHAAASKAYSDGMSELEATDIVQQKLLSEIEQLVKVKEASAAGAEPQEIDTSVFDTVDMKELGGGEASSQPPCSGSVAQECTFRSHRGCGPFHSPLKIWSFMSWHLTKVVDWAGPAPQDASTAQFRFRGLSCFKWALPGAATASALALRLTWAVGGEKTLASILERPGGADQEIHQRNIELEKVQQRRLRLQADVSCDLMFPLHVCPLILNSPENVMSRFIGHCYADCDGQRRSVLFPCIAGHVNKNTGCRGFHHFVRDLTFLPKTCGSVHHILRCSSGE